VGDNEAKAQSTEVATTDKQSNPNGADTTQANNGAAQSAAPNASGEKSSSSAPIPNEVDNAQQAHETMPAKAVDEPKDHKDPEVPPPTGSPLPPPVPDKDGVVQESNTISGEPPTSPQTTETATSNVVDAIETSEILAPSSEAEADMAAKGDSLDPEAASKDPAPQPDAVDSHASGEGSGATQGEGTKSDEPSKLTLRMDRLRESSTASMMSSSSVETPASEVASSAVEAEEEGGAADAAGTSSKSKKKKKSQKKKKGEKNSPRAPSGAAVNDLDDTVKQETSKLVIPALVDVPPGEDEGVLVQKEDNSSSGEDSAVMVEKPTANADTGADAENAGDTTGSEEWLEFSDN
jgi:hypothetical protein